MDSVLCVFLRFSMIPAFKKSYKVDNKWGNIVLFEMDGKKLREEWYQIYCGPHPLISFKKPN